ncbi:MAG TPA: HlyD family efflux transporter periplasmic adaptor subunit [Candidatus Paceibacterota bacterium]|nr:HlyD family efflux transporter periplasmic adaptor subunit [Candidatus Paceibacterota bacterium]
MWHSRFLKLSQWIKTHKLLAIGILVVILLVGSYFVVKLVKSKQVSNVYTLAKVTKGPFINTITDTGQVELSDQLDLKAKASGDITNIYVAEGDTVKSGATIAKIACTQAYYNLQSAQLNLAKWQQTNPLSQTQLQNALKSSQDNQAQLATDLHDAYQSAYDAVGNVTVGTPAIISSLNDVFYSANGFLSDQRIYSQDETTRDYVRTAGRDFDSARAQYTAMFQNYRLLNRNSDYASLKQLLDSAYSSTQNLVSALKEAKNATDHIAYDQSDLLASQAAVTTQNNLNTWINQASAYLQTLDASRSSIDNIQMNIDNANRTIIEKTQALENDTSPLDLQSLQLALAQAQTNYNDCFVRAPFDGVIAKIDAKIAHPVNSGDVVATLVTKNKTVTLDVNEIDATKISVNQTASVTFDAIDGLTLPGKVSKVDNLGSVSSGVVSYGVTVTLEQDDERVKPGMSANVTITVENKAETLLIPNAALKSGSTGSYYVEVAADANIDVKGNVMTTTVKPKRQMVQTGSSNDTVTEIKSGLKEGDLVVIKTVNANSTTKTTIPNYLGNNSRTSSSLRNNFGSLGAGLGAAPMGGGISR